MKKIIEKIENLEFSTREYFMAGLLLFVVGLLFGIIVSPKGDRAYGSNNGNNNSGCLTEETNCSSCEEEN